MRASGRTDVYPIHTVSGLCCLEAISRLVGAVIRLVGCERNGEAIDHALVKEIVGSFVSPDGDGNVQEHYLTFAKNTWKFQLSWLSKNIASRLRGYLCREQFLTFPSGS